MLYKRMHLIWKNGIGKALVLMALRRETNLTEDLLFDIWSETMARMYSLMNAEADWRSVCKEKQIEAFEGKTLSFENFQKEIFDPQFEVEFSGSVGIN